MPRGRPPKPKAAHILSGTFREDRHGGAEPPATGVPERPRGLKGEARKLWDQVVPQLVANGTAKNLDTAALVACCDLWGKFRAASLAADADPTDRAARAAVIAYHSAWERTASKLGLTPADRARLRHPASASSPENDIEDVLSGRKSG